MWRCCREMPGEVRQDEGIPTIAVRNASSAANYNTNRPKTVISVFIAVLRREEGAIWGYLPGYDI